MKLIISALTWLMIFVMMYVLNGMGSTLDTGIMLDTLYNLMALSSFCALLLATRIWGNFDISSSPTFRTRTRDVYVSGNRIDVLPKYAMGTSMLVINFFICLLYPVIFVIDLIKMIFGKSSKITISVSNFLVGLIFFGVSALLFVAPLSAHVYRVNKYDCEKLEYKLLDVYYTEGDGTKWTHVDLKVSYPLKEISSVAGTLQFYVDGELHTSEKYSIVHNKVTHGVISIKPGEKEDLSEIEFKTSFPTPQVDLVTLFNERSDRLVIVHQLDEASFMKGIVSAEYNEFFDDMIKVTLYSSEEYISKNDNGEENRTLYDNAVELYNAGKYSDALKAFNEIKFFGDSAEYIEKCKFGIIDEKYISAIALYETGKYEDALAEFKNIKGHKEANDYVEKCNYAITDREYTLAVDLYLTKKYEEAYLKFSEIKGHKDSLEYIDKIETDATKLAETYATASNFDSAISLLTVVGLAEKSELYALCVSARNGEYAGIINFLGMEEFVIPNGVVSIENKAFYECTSLKRVEIPASVKTIGMYAFSGCTGIAELNIPEGVEEIYDRAFEKCTSLTSVVLPKSLENVYNAPFYKCESINKITTPLNRNFKIIDLFHLYNGYLPQQKNIPASLKTIEITSGNAIPNGFFSYIPPTVTNISFNEDIVEIGENAYANSGLAINVPDSVKQIKDGAFSYMSTSEKVVIPEGVEELGNNVFEGTAFYEIYLPSTLKSVGNNCFAGKGHSTNTYLKKIYFKGSKNEWQSVAKSGWSNALGSYPSTVTLVCSDAIYVFNDVAGGSWKGK